MGRRLRALVLAGALIAASVSLATTTAAAAAPAPRLSIGTVQSAGATMSNPTNKLAITFPSSCCPDGTVGTSYSQRFFASGGTPPYHWSIARGQLPPGLQIFSETTAGHPGLISGTPTAVGSFGFAVRVTDLEGDHVDMNGKITIH
jgi:hypothetical protein